MRTVIAGTTIKRWGNRSTILIKEEDMPNLHEILIAATQLERFAWYLPFLPLTETTRILQTRCSNLHSIECFLGHQGWDDLDRYHNIFAFHDLRYFSLDAPRPSRLRHEYSQKLAPLLRACPNLEVLSIRISGTNVSGSSWSLNAILALLENTTLSCLHTLRVHGELDENWDGFFSLPEMSPLRGFLLRHPTLRTITFGGNYRKQDVRCSPESVETFFPSLRDFTAAPPLCGAVIHSLLAAQIRSFSITDIREDQMDLIPQAFRLMPELRVFSARFGFGGGSARTIAEKHVTVYHPRLEALELEPKVHDFVGMIPPTR
ncbi:hypothetical protein FRC09_006815 [Ceratobasidium sp. 395]|nr:hypothetical protein FRC09_006815 [Ceratobasidium sp. 395]